MHCIWLQIALTPSRCPRTHCRGDNVDDALTAEEAPAASPSEGGKASASPAAIKIHVVAGDCTDDEDDEEDKEEEREVVCCTGVQPLGECCPCATILGIVVCMA
jgi:hypothetical protein